MPHTKAQTLPGQPAKPRPIARIGAKVGARYDRLAALYDAVDLAEVVYKRRVRPRLFAGLSGRILDAGIGTGCNMPFYPRQAWTVGMDLSPGMLVHAKERAARLGRQVNLVAMDLTNTGFEDESFEAVVSAFTFCTLYDDLQRPALVEMARILKPGGQIRILDYALSRWPVVRQAMQAYQVWEKAVWHGAFDRGTEHYLAPAGFTDVREDSYVGDMVRLFTATRRA